MQIRWGDEEVHGHNSLPILSLGRDTCWLPDESASHWMEPLDESLIWNGHGLTTGHLLALHPEITAQSLLQVARGERTRGIQMS